ncbi:uncharacterized protein LOC112097628 [Citrus clementina]|uniref:uncharacterized protein LOC112097628 n=1 Tax=Citrus clementina TaxID=85681 RepID=UPI000CED3D78|nr:uncharacterized protein LOC112097628 [Citrus x clementina]
MSLKIAKNLLRECKALKKNIIAVDPGSKYIGLALANFEQNYVEMTPLGHITQTTKTQDLEQLRKHINDHNVGGLIIGDPIVGEYDETGEGLRRAKHTKTFMKDFDKYINTSYCYQNETNSSESSTRTLKEFEVACQKPFLDEVSAMSIMAQCFCDNCSEVSDNVALVRGRSIHFGSNED